MMDLHKILYKLIVIVTGVQKSHLGKNLTDYGLKDCYRLNI